VPPYITSKYGAISSLYQSTARCKPVLIDRFRFMLQPFLPGCMQLRGVGRLSGGILVIKTVVDLSLE
jgi:hypothetical protein